MSKLNWTYNDFAPRGNYVGGAFHAPKKSSGIITATCPADLSDKIGSFPFFYEDADRAVQSARDAFKTWRLLSQESRVEYLVRYRDALKKLEIPLTEAIAREVGKPLWEARQEVLTMINKVDITIGEGLALIADKITPNIMPGTAGAWRNRPHGVFVVVGPYNFPGHLANGHIVPALASGNTVIFKPSEKAPLVGQLMADAMQEAGIPTGVFNLVQGDAEVGRRLTAHEGIDGVLFTGSYEVGLKIKQDTLTHFWKLIVLEMGGKNSTIILDDAEFGASLYETLTSAFITTGQRCTATSRILVHESLHDRFVEEFHLKAKKFAIGHPLEDVFMGPLIDASAVDKFLKFQNIAGRENCEVIMHGKKLELDYKGHYVTPSISLVRDTSLDSVKKSIFQQTEIFGPSVAIYSFSTDEEAVRLANATQFGLAASVFTSTKERYDQMREQLRFGVINWNRSTVGASSRLPFGGLKRSGNHFPTGISASHYCTYPMSSLEVAEPAVPANVLPGLNWS